MKFTRFQIGFIILAIIILATFSFSGARGFRIFSMFNVTTYAPTGPGLYHK